MPLDYGGFGTAKRQLQAEMGPEAPWEEKVEHFKKLLMRSANSIIAEFPLRLDACINAGGTHIGEELQQLKKKLKRGEKRLA
jgi:hypothetical protein